MQLLLWKSSSIVRDWGWVGGRNCLNKDLSTQVVLLMEGQNPKASEKVADLIPHVKTALKWNEAEQQFQGDPLPQQQAEGLECTCNTVPLPAPPPPSEANAPSPQPLLLT